MRALILGTRGSALALAQTALARAALAAIPDDAPAVEVCEIKTTGDRRQDLVLTDLTASGHGHVVTATGENLGVGLFTKELEAALLRGEIDVAVHSLKDLPTTLPAGLVLAATLPRADTADVLISKVPTADLPANAAVATSSLRRQRQLLLHRPGWRVAEVRGNVGTRLGKLRARADWDGLILARAGLARLGFAADLDAGFLQTEHGRFFVETLGLDVMLPAVGQGAIGLQCRAGDSATLARLAAVNHPPTWVAVTVERALLALLGGGCQLPLGVATEIHAGTREMTLRAILFPAPGAPPRHAFVRGSLAAPAAALARAAAGQLARA